MGLAEVQGALARLAIDPGLRDRFFADPAEAGIELGLVEQEALQLARMPRGQVDQFAESLRRKRRDQVRRVVPITARALGQEFPALFERYMNESAPRGSKPGLDDASGFIAAIGRWSDRLEPPWAADLGRYELAWREAARVGRMPIVRMFRYPVGRLATSPKLESVAPQVTLACWWRLSRRGIVRHLLLSIPRLGFRSWP
jgi:hypothetical protein